MPEEEKNEAVPGAVPAEAVTEEGAEGGAAVPAEAVPA